MDTIHLICNAHIDPVWLWEWEEGMATALSTFRAAADFCEEFEGFVFNHNESLLYEYIERSSPELFERIRTLVKKGQWKIMGGWFLQPDCNLPSCESIFRQIETGQAWFEQKFGIQFGRDAQGSVSTAINFDPFGHSRGLVQILRKKGYSSYLVCRPNPDTPGYEIREDLFEWVGFDGSSVTVLRSPYHYNSVLGKVEKKIDQFVRKESGTEGPGLLLWGVGNHGGGASRQDIRTIAELSKQLPLRHSDVESYFTEIDTYLKEYSKSLPRVSKGLNPWGTGCYTSQIRIKKRHRELENQLFFVEKMASHAAGQQLHPYPAKELAEAQRDLLLMQFHDILPGSGVPAVEEYGLRLAAHGMEILSRIRFDLLCAFMRNEAPVPAGSYPIYLYNPHPHHICGIFSCELNWEEQNFSEQYSGIRVTKEEQTLASQIEKEDSNISIDWRKRVVFKADAAPGLNRLIAFHAPLDAQKEHCRQTPHELIFENSSMTVRINRLTGLLTSYLLGDSELIGEESIVPVVLEDSDDPWDMLSPGNLPEKGRFRLMTREEAAEFRGTEHSDTAAVTVIESGAVRTAIEALFTYGASRLRLTYSIPAEGKEIDIALRVHWNEVRSILKLQIPTGIQDRRAVTQVMAGRESLRTGNLEQPGQKWVVVHDDIHALAIINDCTYGVDFQDSVLRISLLRSPAYAAHPIEGRPLVRDNRYIPRIDQGIREFNFRMYGGDTSDVLKSIDTEAQQFAEAPYLLSMFPYGEQAHPSPYPLEFEGKGVILHSMRVADEYGKRLRFRLQETVGETSQVVLRLMGSDDPQRIRLRPFEIAEYLYDPDSQALSRIL